MNSHVRNVQKQSTQLLFMHHHEVSYVEIPAAEFQEFHERNPVSLTLPKEYEGALDFTVGDFIPWSCSGHEGWAKILEIFPVGDGSHSVRLIWQS